MSINFADDRGTISQIGNVMRVQNALVEEVAVTDRNSGFVLISHAVRRPNNMVSIENLRLNVSRNTTIISPLGRPMQLRDIRVGMRVDAVFSSAMTRSIPPQANAFLIVARTRRQPPMSVTTDRVVSVDNRNNFLYTGNPRNINRQMRFVISDSTIILGRNGNPISLRSLRPGQLVQVTHANFQTASIPPQSTAFYVQVL